MNNVINEPALVAELTELYMKYETALCSNDTAVLDNFFWDSADVVRFGLNENLYGAEDIRAFRNSRPAFKLEREILNLKVVTFGEDSAAVTLEFRRLINNVERRGRQSQMWYRFPQGWKVVSAHVSFLKESRE
ncbi:oxalurate catabolism protein HpxZ [Rivularia sp. UHCC 0363]|uniref:oxalurate catabolism protein HpxZ n=1 Tax=Rivularia sp. UHCC 0363 TaxID=3110244 RepID=UPI002B21DA16|nr:oxalurate catabolism protein HpxZ [Rivularia sp. UHCC 0363]MEA5594260.1 oxalurate catabolism protein HpxZ [Rivularia sp. UHCC 0363]